MLSAFTNRIGLTAPAELSSPKTTTTTIPPPPTFSIQDTSIPSLAIQSLPGITLSTAPSLKVAPPSYRTPMPSPPPPSFNISAPDPSDSEEDEEEEDDENDLNIPIQEDSLKLSPSVMVTKTSELNKRIKVNIEPGYSQLHWAKLKSSGADLRGGVTQIIRVTPTELAKHNTREDCWQAYNGKVYNVTPYLKYHPGGIAEVMRARGKDGTELFMKSHAWVNVDLMMSGCMVGVMVRE